MTRWEQEPRESWATSLQYAAFIVTAIVIFVAVCIFVALTASSP